MSRLTPGLKHAGLAQDIADGVVGVIVCYIGEAGTEVAGGGGEAVQIVVGKVPAAGPQRVGDRFHVAKIVVVATHEKTPDSFVPGPYLSPYEHYRQQD